MQLAPWRVLPMDWYFAREAVHANLPRDQGQRATEHNEAREERVTRDQLDERDAQSRERRHSAATSAGARAEWGRSGSPNPYPAIHSRVMQLNAHMTRLDPVNSYSRSAT